MVNNVTMFRFMSKLYIVIQFETTQRVCFTVNGASHLTQHLLSISKTNNPVQQNAINGLCSLTNFLNVMQAGLVIIIIREHNRR